MQLVFPLKLMLSDLTSKQASIEKNFGSIFTAINKLMKYYQAIIVILICCTGCLAQRTHEAESNNIVRVYFDKRGNIYPPRQLYVPFKNFFDPVKKLHTGREKESSGNLASFYQQNPSQLNSLASHYLTNAYNNNIDSFNAIQEKFRSRYADSVAGLCRQLQNKMVVLIHGFNDPDPTGDYQDLRNRIRSSRLLPVNTAYLEIYWDALTANNANPATARIWSRAQRNSAYVSLALRDLLRRLPANTSLRIITHSLGAGLATGALFNTTTKWKSNTREQGAANKKERWDYFNAVEQIPAPAQSDIRIAMFAPAIPGENTFVDFDKRNWSGPWKNNIHRIVIGFNRNDYAVTKRVAKSDMLANRLGSTSLGCNKNIKGVEEIDRVKHVLDAMEHKDLVYPIDFTVHPFKTREEHALYSYLLNSKASDFIRTLLE